VYALWRKIGMQARNDSAQRWADTLFALRMIPLLVATGVTLLLAVPSFLLLEPRAVDEALGLPAGLLGCCGLALIAVGFWNAGTAWIKALRTVARWSGAAQSRELNFSSLDVGASFAGLQKTTSASILRSAVSAWPLTAAGVLRPSVWLTSAAESVLNERELAAALQHEFVHVRRWDNLRKLILRLVAFPGMAGLESAWRQATEMAADDAAVSSAAEALDLASAVIKLSRLVPLQAPPDLTTALVQNSLESVNARVERLVTWSERQQIPAPKYSWRYALCGAAATIVTLAAMYSTLLLRMHMATEWLVR